LPRALKSAKRISCTDHSKSPSPQPLSHEYVGEGEMQPMESSATNWTCITCRESNDANFAACWNCGTTREGESDPQFRSIVEKKPDDEIVCQHCGYCVISLPKAICPECGTRFDPVLLATPEIFREKSGADFLTWSRPILVTFVTLFFLTVILVVFLYVKTLLGF